MDHTGATDPSRREMLGAGAAFLSILAAKGLAQQGAAHFAYVGCFTTAQRYARGDGIHVYRMDAATGGWTHTQRVPNLVNPSFLAIGRNQRHVYSAHGDETYATAFSVERETGQLTPIGRAATGGSNGVHLVMDPSGRFVLVANYASGNIGVLPARPDGSLGDAAQLVPLEGQPGPHRVEQAGSHPHQIVFDPSGRYVVVPDKGLDRVFVFRFDPDSGKLTPTAQGSAVARPGSGPRHAAFHPTLPVLWVVNEIGSSVGTYFWDAERGHLRAAQLVPSLPADHTSENTASGIAVAAGGRFVYCSNRGHDSVAIFAADEKTGFLRSIGWAATQGRTPRFIGFDAAQRFLYAANEQSDTIVAWSVDRSNGRLTAAGKPIENASPAVIAFSRGSM